MRPFVLAAAAVAGLVASVAVAGPAAAHDRRYDDYRDYRGPPPWAYDDHGPRHRHRGPPVVVVQPRGYYYPPPPPPWVYRRPPPPPGVSITIPFPFR